MAGPSETLQAVSCPNCGDTLPIRALGLAVNTACVSCGAVVDTVEQRNKVLYFQKNVKRFGPPKIPLGKRGTYEGRQWEAIGWQVREDVDSRETWEEYLLFNPRYGYRWLTCYKGHWNWVRSIYDKMHPHQQRDSEQFIWDNQPFKVYHKGKARTLFVQGEFYWRLKRGYTVKVRDYIAPPLQISLEVDEAEVSCSLAQYISREEVRKMFDLPSLPSNVWNVAPNQPRPFPATWPMVGVFVALALLLAIVQGMLNGQREPQVLSRSRGVLIYPGKSDSMLDYAQFVDRYKYSAENAGISDSLPPFREDSMIAVLETIRNRHDASGSSLQVPEIKIGPFNLEKRTNLRIVCLSNISNNWMELEYVLYSPARQEARYFYDEMEFYFGNDDGSWQEGSRYGSEVVSSVPAGQWYLITSGLAGTSQHEPLVMQVQVTADVKDWSNFWLAFIILAVAAGIWVFVSENFEYRRWKDSAYTPYDMDLD